MTELEQIAINPISRRQFLARMSAAGLGAAAVALLAGCSGSSNGGGHTSSGGGGGTGGNSAFALPAIVGGGLIPGVGDIQVLNYALALETTEADIYRQALNLATGLPQTAPLAPAASMNSAYTGLSGTVSSTGVTNATAAYDYLRQYAYVEAAHRDFLLTTLGHSADTVGQPTTSNTSNPVVYSRGYKFVPATANSLSSILELLLIAEETGVTAYLGAVPYISSLSYAQVAASIYSTEARHSSGIRYILGDDIGPGNLMPADSVPTGPFVSGSAHPSGTPGTPVNEFEFALDPTSVLQDVVSTFYNTPSQN
jgi:hypothetical protein